MCAREGNYIPLPPSIDLLAVNCVHREGLGWAAAPPAKAEPVVPPAPPMASSGSGAQPPAQAAAPAAQLAAPPPPPTPPHCRRRLMAWVPRCKSCRYKITGWVTYHDEEGDRFVAYCYSCTDQDPATNSEDGKADWTLRVRCDAWQNCRTIRSSAHVKCLK